MNDDYCDCPDGSDEPGSAACAHLSPLSPQTASNIAAADVNTTVALPGFYCKNQGHNPTYISFTYINDGICDYEVCCDGSDEWKGVGGVKCPDRCVEIGKEWRSHEERRQKSMTAAMRRRKELVTDAARVRREIGITVKDLETQIQASEAKVAQLEKEKEEIELREKSRVVKKSGVGGKASIVAGIAKERLSQLKEALTNILEERNGYRSRLEELEAIMTTFKEEYNPNFNDEGVKRAVRSWDDYAARDTSETLDRDRDYIDMAKGDGEPDWEEFEKEDQVDTNARDVEVCK